MAVILNLMFGWRRGGLERAAAHYHLALASRGHRVITVGHRQSWLRTQLPKDAAFVAMSPFTDYDPRVHVALLRSVHTHRPSALIAHGNRAMRYAARMSDARRIGVFHNFQFKPYHARLDAGIAVSKV